MCIYFVLNKYYFIIILYGGSHASDILHVLMGVSVAKLIIYNIVLLFICHNKRSSSSSSSGCEFQYVGPYVIVIRNNYNLYKCLLVWTVVNAKLWRCWVLTVKWV